MRSWRSTIAQRSSRNFQSSLSSARMGLEWRDLDQSDREGQGRVAREGKADVGGGGEDRLGAAFAHVADGLAPEGFDGRLVHQKCKRHSAPFRVREGGVL